MKDLKLKNWYVGIAQKCLAFCVIPMLLIGSTSVLAQESSADSWQSEFELYFWLPQMNIGTEGGEITLSLKDLIDNLDFMAMADWGTRKGKWSMGVDAIYMNLGTTQTIDGDIIGHPVDVEAEIDMRGFISTINGGYQIAESENNRADFIFGARYLDIRLPLTFQGEQYRKRVSLSGHNWDYVVGLQGVRTINDKWYFDYYGDIGAGDSDLTWQAKLGFGYAFSKFTGTFGFRYLRFDFDSGDQLEDLDVIGPYMGFKWNF